MAGTAAQIHPHLRSGINLPCRGSTSSQCSSHPALARKLPNAYAAGAEPTWLGCPSLCHSASRPLTMPSLWRRRAAQAASMGRRPHRNLERKESSAKMGGGGVRWCAAGNVHSQPVTGAGPCCSQACTTPGLPQASAGPSMRAMRGQGRMLPHRRAPGHHKSPPAARRGHRSPAAW